MTGPMVGLIYSQAGRRFGVGISFANFLRFWAVAARRNSSCAPFGPLNLSRPSGGIGLMRCRCLFSVDLGVGLDPLAEFVVGNLEIIVLVKSRDDVDADVAVIGVIVS